MSVKRKLMWARWSMGQQSLTVQDVIARIAETDRLRAAWVERLAELSMPSAQHDQLRREINQVRRAAMRRMYGSDPK